MSSFGRPHVSRLVFLALVLMALVGAAKRSDAQGANHAGGNGGDAIRCVSPKPEIAIPACSNIIKDKREESENRAIALRNAQLALISDLRHHRVKVSFAGTQTPLPEKPAFWAAFSLSGQP